MASLLQKNQECSKLVNTEIEKSLIEKSYGEKKKYDQKSGVLGQFSFIIPLNLAAFSRIAIKNPNLFFADFVWVTF